MKQTPIEEELQYREPMQVSEIMLCHRNPYDFSEQAYPLCPRCDCPLEYDYQCFCEQCGQKLKWTQYNKATVTPAGNIPRFNEPPKVIKVATTFKSIIITSGMDLRSFSKLLDIPFDTCQTWYEYPDTCPEYLLKLIEYKLDS